MGKALASTLAEVMPRTKFGGGQCSRRCLFCFNSGNFPQKKIRKLTVRSRKLEFRFRFWNYGHHIQRSLVLHLLALVFIFVGVYVRYNVLSFLKIITKGTICRRHRRSSGERWHQQWQSINDDDLSSFIPGAANADAHALSSLSTYAAPNYPSSTSTFGANCNIASPLSLGGKKGRNSFPQKNGKFIAGIGIGIKKYGGKALSNQNRKTNWKNRLKKRTSKGSRRQFPPIFFSNQKNRGSQVPRHAHL